MMCKDWAEAMTSKEAWQKATRELIAEERARAGPPPTFEEVDALSRGELSEDQAEDVRERLSYYPDLLAVLAHPFPADTEGVLTGEQLAEDLAKIRQQTRRAADAPAPVAFPQRGLSPRTMALAAGIVIAIAVGSFAVWRSNVEPRAISAKALFPDGVRGGMRGGGPEQPPAQLSAEIDYDLELFLGTANPRGAIRIELYDVSSDPARRLWTRERVQPRANGAFPLQLETANLEPGLYRLVVARENEERIAEYTLRLTSSPARNF